MHRMLPAEGIQDRRCTPDHADCGFDWCGAAWRVVAGFRPGAGRPRGPLTPFPAECSGRHCHIMDYGDRGPAAFGHLGFLLVRASRTALPGPDID